MIESWGNRANITSIIKIIQCILTQKKLIGLIDRAKVNGNATSAVQ